MATTSSGGLSVAATNFLASLTRYSAVSSLIASLGSSESQPPSRASERTVSTASSLLRARSFLGLADLGDESDLAHRDSGTVP